MNQDCCEFHFGHVHAAGHPAQSNANACALTSHLKQSIRASAKENITIVKKRCTILLNGIHF
jgi:hypothetical protein